MKKNYVKPQLWKESFQPADAIAGGCDTDVGFTENTCEFYDSWYDANVFAVKGVCETVWVDGDDKGCYHNPTDSMGYFGS